MNEDAVSGLLDAGINPNAPNQKGVTPISAASHKGSTIIIQKLVDAGASVNAINTTGSTALIQASHFGHFYAVQLLLRHGSIADFANSKGTTALMRASQEGYVQIVALLLAAKSEVNRKNNEGMNSLMLASQRGHEQVVLVLVQAGATMDEQTSQGSTALMLACKRGHEAVVEVLVACGAEIYMRDCRARSARDTAQRRHHQSLLTRLDTQVQIGCLQQSVRIERAELLASLRQAAIHEKLQYHPETKRILLLMQGVSRYECAGGSDLLIGPDEFHRVVQRVMGSSAPSCAAGYRASFAKTISSAPSSAEVAAPASSSAVPTKFRNTWAFPTDMCVANINSSASSSFIATAPYLARHPLPAPAGMAPHRPGYAPWQWPLLLKKVFDLPLGVYELVVDFLPAPRIWKTGIHRLKRRVTLAPQAATLDISIMIDEMLTDMSLFHAPPSAQRGHLVTVARSEGMAKYLSEQWHMPSSLLRELVVWSDVQSLIARSADIDVSFKANLARRFLQLAASLYRYSSTYANPRMLFTLSSLGSASFGGDDGEKNYGRAAKRRVNQPDRCKCSRSPGSESSEEDQKECQELVMEERNSASSDLMDIDFLVDIEDDCDQDDDQENDQDDDQGDDLGSGLGRGGELKSSFCGGNGAPTLDLQPPAPLCRQQHISRGEEHCSDDNEHDKFIFHSDEDDI